MHFSKLRRVRLVAALSLLLLLPTTMWWFWYRQAMLVGIAAKALAALPFLIEPQAHFRYYLYLFPQIVITEDPVTAFLRDFPEKYASPSLEVEGGGIGVLQYFNLVRGVLDHHHVRFGIYPPPDDLPPLNTQEYPDFWPSLGEARCQYIQLDRDSFLLGWAGPDRVFADLQTVRETLDRPYGLRVVGDDWWVRCRYFDFSAYRRNYPELAREIKLEPGQIELPWALIQRLNQAKGINVDQILNRIQVHSHDARINWVVLLYQPISLLLLGGVLLSSSLLLLTYWRK